MSAGADARAAEVWERLRTVTDPELDEPVTELGFVTAVEVDAGNRVHIGFRLPTYWCAANFAFLMVDGVRRAAESLPWASGVTVRLGEHMSADEINGGVGCGGSFAETFGREAAGDLAALRRTFELKSFQRRQERVLRHLLGLGWAADAVLSLRIGELAGLELDEAGRRLVESYLERRPAAGPVEAGQPAFLRPDGSAIATDGLFAHLADLRRVRVTMELNGALCRGLLATRFGEEATEPELLRFLRPPPAGPAREGRP